MKKPILIALLSIFGLGISHGQNSEVAAVEKAVQNFISAGDNSDADKLAESLDANYRIIMNQLFGSTEISIVDRDLYLEKIASKEWGGDKRQINFESIVINGNTASVKVLLTGEKMKVSSLLSLAKDSAGNWKIMSDMPVFI